MLFFMLLVIGGGIIAWYEYNKVCCAFPDEPEWQTPSGERPELGVMSSLPIIWPLDASMEDIAASTYQTPWLGGALARDFELIPLDTLSPISALSPDQPDSDPLKGVERIAIIQPRGLSPSDNVALDNWVRAGGQLLLVLDPMLTGDYDLPLGDPRRPSDTALIPPVVARWGMEVSFDPQDSAKNGIKIVPFEGRELFVMHSGRIAANEVEGAQCTLFAENLIARCEVGQGSATLVADAALFEHSELIGDDAEHLRAVMRFAMP